MTPTEMKELVREFSKTLDDKQKDEWYASDRGIWEASSKRFVQWYNDHGRAWLERRRDKARRRG